MRAALLAAAAAGAAPASPASAGGAVRPVIAIFAAPSNSTHPDCGGGCDYVAASYVKRIEGAGGRALPVSYHAGDAHAGATFKSVNGVLFPGGGASLPDAARGLWDASVAANRAGDHFPVWYLGFEWLMKLAAGNGWVVNDSNTVVGFASENISLALDLTPAAAASRLYQQSYFNSGSALLRTNVTFAPEWLDVGWDASTGLPW
eukprot:gene2020-6689_t